MDLSGKAFDGLNSRQDLLFTVLGQLKAQLVLVKIVFDDDFDFEKTAHGRT